MKLWLLIREDSGEMVLNSIWEDQPESYAAIGRIVGEGERDYRIIRGIAITIEGTER